MMVLYNLPEYDTPDEFFLSLSEATGKVKKGGLPDIEKAARQLLEDWNRWENLCQWSSNILHCFLIFCFQCRGKIKYYTQPPEEESTEISASIVTEAAAEFDIDSFQEMEAENLQQFEESASKNVKGIYMVFYT